MTSANVTLFRIERSRKVVGSHYQHHYCKTHWSDLLKFEPIDEHTITPHGLDEEEEEWEGDTMPLRKFLESKRVFCPNNPDT